MTQTSWPPLQATGKTMDDYVNSHQDKSRNAMNKAVEASFQAWVEELRADQAQFTSEKVTNLDWPFDIFLNNKKMVVLIYNPNFFQKGLFLKISKLHAAQCITWGWRRRGQRRGTNWFVSSRTGFEQCFVLWLTFHFFWGGSFFWEWLARPKDANCNFDFCLLMFRTIMHNWQSILWYL